MKKQLRKIALAVVFAMAVALLAPAEQVAFAAAKMFTYAEQKTGDKVTTLFMERGEKVDLKFMGIPDYKNYKLKWVSSNEKVAVVDSNGVITALSDVEATATIRLIVGDQKNYTSMGVVVHVNKDQKVTIGTAAKTEIKSHTLEMGKSVMLKANGLTDNVGGRYVCTWTSTDPSVATISSTGLVTTVAPGLTVIQLSVKKVSSGEVMTATPVALLVTAAGTSAPVATATPTPTPTPTVKPGATATPTPTPIPVITATPTPTPAPVVETGNYSVTVTTDRSITLKFANAVEYTVSDFELSEVLAYDGGDYLNKKDIAAIETDATGKTVTITMVDKLVTGRYNIKVGGETQGRTFPVSIGIPTRMEIVYTCLGRTNTAYAYDDEIGIDVPVNISCKLYSGNVDVTESYIDSSGNIELELVSPVDSDDVYLEGEQLYFYAPKKVAMVRATYTYYTESGATKELRNTARIEAKEIGDYTITHVADWTIIDATDNNATIDWNNTVKKVVAGKENYKIVALLADSYGYYYSTDERGVNKSKNIYSVDDEETLFALKGYTYSFNTSNDDYFYIDDNGDLYTYKAKQNAATYITLYNPDEWSSGERNVGAWQFTILEESKLSTVKIDETKITLLTEANNNEERFCEADVVVTLYDQYGYKWNGEAYLEVSSSTTAVNNSIDEVTSIDKGEKEGEWILHIDAQEMYPISKNKKSVSLVVTETETKKKATLSVEMKNPANAKGEIVIDDWAVGMKEGTITFGDGELSEVDAKAEVEIYQVSKTGDYNVGLITNGNIDEKDNLNLFKLQKEKNPSWSSAKAGEIYVLVLGPDNKVVELAENKDDLGVWMDPATGEVSVNLTSSEGESLICMKEGLYTVKVTKINKDGGSSKLMKSATFTVVDNTKDVTFTGLKSSRTELGASDAAEIVIELCNFRLGGASWTTVTESMITNVKYELRSGGKKIYIESVEFAVPADGKSESGVITYKKTVNIKKTVSINVED